MIYRELKYLCIYNWGGAIIFDAGLAAGLRLVVKVSLVYVFEASIITYFVLMNAKVLTIFETTKFFGDFFERSLNSLGR